MSDTTRGFFAGLAGTAAFTGFQIAGSANGLLSGFDMIAMLGDLTGTGQIGGWVVQLVLGSIVWGGLFGALGRRLPGGAPVVRGAIFSVLPWLLLMLVLMPLAGHGLFGLALGPTAPVVTFGLHLIFGVVMGAVHGIIGQRASPF